MWKKLSCSFGELNLDMTLGGGQSFRWSKSVDGIWQGIIHGLACSLKRDTRGNLLFQFHTPLDNYTRNEKESLPQKRQKRHSTEDVNSILEEEENFPVCYESILIDYFNLNFALKRHYRVWSEADENFKRVCQKYRGIRILRQDPVENLFSFICSANNNIPRITNMVKGLSTNYGEKLCEVNDHEFYTFPSVSRLAEDDVEMKLRSMGFGYRAKYISETAQILKNKKPQDWLEGLRNSSYQEALRELKTLPGVGRKVADCVCLMSLDKFDAVPIDTHIWQVTVKDYMPHLKAAKTVTRQMYQEAADFYRKRFGEHAGWANTVLFASDLKMFKTKQL